MRLGDFEKLLEEVNSKMLSVALANAEAQRTVNNPKMVTEKYCNYCKAIELLNEFLANGRGTAVVDNAENPLSYHNVYVKLQNDEFDKAEIGQFSEIINLFDGMMIIGTSECNIEFSLIMEDIYVKD